MTSEVEQSLWSRYRVHGDMIAREELIVNYMGMAEKVARTCLASRGCDSLEDAISEAYVALVRCVDRYDPSKGCKFCTLAVQRIRGTVLDLARSAYKLDVPFSSVARTDSEFNPEDMLVAPGPEFLQEESLDNKAVGEVLKMLPVGWRCFIVLRVLEGFSHTEVCASLGFSLPRSLQLVGLIRRKLEVVRAEGRWPWASPN